MIDEFGWYSLATKIASPNFDERPKNTTMELIVIHGISLPPGEFGTNEINNLFLNKSNIDDLKDLKVSAHFLINRLGEITQFVSCNNRAWHCGESTWNNKSACNDFSVGIELEGTDDIAYTDIQYQQLIKLISDLVTTYPKLQKVVGHCHIAPERKTDPGEVFEWNKLFTAIGNHFDGR